MQGRFQLMIRVDDSDIDSNDLVDRVFYDRVLSVSDSFTSQISQVGYCNRATMVASFRVTCDVNFYGSNCNKNCVPAESNTLGYFECDANGDKICRADYMGTNCLTLK